MATVLQPVAHEHHIDLDAALDFLNTLDLDDGQLVEHLEEPAEAAAWFVEHGLIHPDAKPTWNRPDLDRIREVRAAIRDVVDSVVERHPPKARSVDLVNRTLEARRPARVELDGTAIRIGHRHAATPVQDALAVIAEAIVDELASGRPDRFRICANERCAWTFFDSSPTGRRRWCDMSTCGNQAKAARHRAKARLALPI